MHAHDMQAIGEVHNRRHGVRHRLQRRINLEPLAPRRNIAHFGIGAMIGLVHTAPIIFTGSTGNTAQEIRLPLTACGFDLITTVITNIQHFAQATHILGKGLLHALVGDSPLVDGGFQFFK